MLYGRQSEEAALDALIDAAREGRGGALVLRGEAGIGKSALLDRIGSAPAHTAHTAHTADAATTAHTPHTVLRVTGCEAERDLVGAAMLQLLWPVQGVVAELPGPQAAALQTVLGGTAVPADRYTTGLALLTLLARLAESGPVICLVDDAQWLDQSSADALLFAARRISAEPVVFVFAAREEGFDARGLPELFLHRLDRQTATRVLDRYDLSASRREQVLEEADGNPLALLEFGRADRTSGPSGGEHVTERVLASFRAGIAALPADARLLLLTAAADSSRDLASVLAAVDALGGSGAPALESAERAGLLRVEGGRPVFRHPLIRAAAYRSAASVQRARVHGELAGLAADPDVRARHLALAALGPDPVVAVEVARAADRARDRAAPAIACDLYQRAAALSTSGPDRGRLLCRAAAAAVAAGDLRLAAALAERAAPLAGTGADRAAVAEVRAAVEFERGDQAAAARLLVAGAPEADPGPAASMLRTAATYAWFSGDAGSVRACAELLPGDRTVAGMAGLVDGDHRAGLAALRAAAAEGGPGMRPVYAAALLGDDDRVEELATAEVARRRRACLVGGLPEALQMLARLQVIQGRHRDAEASVAEARAIAEDCGMPQRVGRLDVALARIAAIEGDPERCRPVAGVTVDGGVSAACLSGLLDLGLGRYEDALVRLESAWTRPGHYMTVLVGATGDLVEAAVRLGVPERARHPWQRLVSWAEAGGMPWARAVALRCEAQLTGREEAFAEAGLLHGKGGRPFEAARTLLAHGEWLRRARRQAEARARLHGALEVFERLHATPWADRTRAELRAAGESAVPAVPTARALADRLTPQELQVVRLAAEGRSSREIAALLFLSPRTVEHHLYKAYPKLGVRSRTELARLDLD
ncbi:LuxR family transcriptional regulator [Streptomyces sp. NPDC089799]|uniref:LuxR family transcriptional regulator n=1 Tax=Streptomyces sp. NPDC089799 TaxID=3155066 RepID=UPI0034156551